MSGRLDSMAWATTAEIVGRLASQADESPRDAGHVHEVVDQPDQVLDLPVNDGRGLGELRLRKVRQDDELRGQPHRGQGVAQLVREHREELVFPAARVHELGRALRDADFQMPVEPFQLTRLPVEIEKDVDLRAEDLRHDRNGHVVDRSVFVALEPIEIREMDARHEDDRGPAEARVFANQGRQLEAIELGHADVDEDHRKIGPEQVVEGLAGGVGHHEIRLEAVQNGRIGEEFRGLVVDDEDVRVVHRASTPGRANSVKHGFGPFTCGQRCNHMRSADRSCSVFTGLAR